MLEQVKWRPSGQSGLEHILQLEAEGSAQRRDASGSLVTVYSFLIREHREDGARLFSELHSDWLTDTR